MVAAGLAVNVATRAEASNTLPLRPPMATIGGAGSLMFMSGPLLAAVAVATQIAGGLTKREIIGIGNGLPAFLHSTGYLRLAGFV